MPHDGFDTYVDEKNRQFIMVSFNSTFCKMHVPLSKQLSC